MKAKNVNIVSRHYGRNYSVVTCAIRVSRHFGADLVSVLDDEHRRVMQRFAESDETSEYRGDVRMSCLHVSTPVLLSTLRGFEALISIEEETGVAATITYSHLAAPVKAGGWNA